MPTNGRFETRVSLTIPLYLLDPKLPSPSMLALTENVSARGARIVTKQTAIAGENWQIAALSGELRLVAQVIYCEPLSNNNFCIGLRLEHPIQNWWRKGGSASNADAADAIAAQSMLMPKTVKRGKPSASV